MAVQTHSTAAPPITSAGSRPSQGAPAPLRSASHHSASSTMNAGSTMTSRDIQDVRHISTARQARILWPRCRNDAASPAASSSRASASAASRKPGVKPTWNSTAAASSTARPWPAPASVVKNRMEKAGCIAL